MAEKIPTYSEIKKQIDAGNMREAYRSFEKLPIKDQIAISVAPGIGDALAVYEVGEFGRRAKTNVKQSDYLGAAGNAAIAALAGISLYPLLRFLRGARGVTKTATKAVDAPKIIKPPVEEPLQLAPPKELEIKIPKIEPFEPKGIKEINYQAGEFEFGSKARKWLNGIEQPNITTLGKKVQELPVEQWVQRLENAGVPKGELRVLSILDESNSIHPKLIMSADAKKSLTRKSLDDYIARSQRDAIQVRGTPKNLLQNPDTRPDFVNPATQEQFNYFVKGSGEYRKFPHHNQDLKYPDGFSGDNAYVFDGTAKYNVMDRLDDYRTNVGGLRETLSDDNFETIYKALGELDLDDSPGISTGKNLFRMQSDFQEEVARKIRKPQIDQMNSAKSNFDSVVKIPRVYQEANKSIKDAISVGPDARIVGTQRTELMNNLKPEFVDALRANDEQAMRKILGDDLYKTFTDTEFGTRVPGKYFAPVDELSLQGPAISFNQFIYDLIRFNPDANLSQIKEFTQTRNKIGGEALKYIKDNFLDADFDGVVKEIFKRTKNVEKIKQKIFKSNPTGFVKPEQQKIILKRLKNYNKEVDAVNDLTASGADVDIDRIIGSLNRDVTDLGIDRVSLSPKELERVTGKPFTESLDLTPADIYNLTDRFGRRIYKGIDFDDPAALSKAYFDDMADESKTFFEAADGVKVLKKATGINQSQYGMKIDPYFEGGNSKYFKLPVRANILDSAKKGDNFLFIGEQQAAAESFGTDVIKTYQSAQNEIKKVLKELGVSEQGVVKTIKGTGTEFDGTYLKFTEKLKEAIEKQGVNAFKRGGPVENDEIKSTYKNPLNDQVLKIINTDIQELHEDVVRPKFKKLGIDKSEIKLKKDYSFFGDTSYNAYYVLADAYLDGKITQDDIYEYFRKVQPENFLDKDGGRYKNMQNMFNASDQDSYFYDIIRGVKTQKEAEKQYRALIKRLKKDHNVTVLDYEYGNPQNKRQKITDFMFQVGGETPRANVGMARPFIDPSGEAIINMPVTHDFKEKLRTLNEELFHVGQFRDEQLTGKPIDRLRNVKYLLPKGIRGLIPSDPNVEFLTKSSRETLKDTIGYKLGTHSHQYGRYHDPEATEGIHKDYQQSEEYLKQFGLSTTDPESFTYRDPKSERFFQNPRKQYAGFAEGGEVPSIEQQKKLSKAKLDEIQAQLQDILTTRVYDNLLKDRFDKIKRRVPGSPLDELYQDFDVSKDVVKNIESQVSKNLAKSLKLPYQDAISDILQADDPSKEFAKRKDAFQLRKIDEAISALNLPLDVNVGLDSAQITKEIPLPGNVDLAFGAFKDPNRDVKTAAGLGFTESGKFGDLDIFGATGDYMPPGLYADYTLGDIKKGPLQVDVTKTPGSDIDTKAQLKIGDKTSPFQFDVMKQPGRDYALSGRYTLDKDIFPADSLYGQTYRVPTQLEISKQPNQDLYGKYEIDILGGEGQSLAPIRDFNIAPGTRLGGRGSIGLSFMVDTLKNAGLRLQYMYENPKTGGFFNITYDPRKPTLSQIEKKQATAFGLPQVFPDVPLEDLVGYADPKDKETYFFKEDPLPNVMDVNNILNIEFGREF